jgi:peptide/nickel transport system substrate-binding protein
MKRPLFMLMALLAIPLAACTPSAPSGSPSTGSGLTAGTQPSRTLVAAVRNETDTLAIRPLLGGQLAAFQLTRGLFNAELTYTTPNGSQAPYLAEALPQLSTDTWRVSPDGQMETTWKLKPGLVWQDGTPLSPQDFVFAWQVYSTPTFGGTASRSMQSIQDVASSDDRTFVVRWKQPFPNANDLSGNDGLPPLPRHLLEHPFQQLEPTAFAGTTFWTREYVGLGPYRVEQWEPGAFYQAAAFDRYLLGRPKIERIKVLFITDVNTALANLMANQVQLATDNSISLQQSVNLKRDWAQQGAGAVLFSQLTWQFTVFQLRPELVSPQALLDVRVRRALGHAVNKQELSDSVYGGELATSDFFISPLSKWGPAVESAVQKYPYDLRRSEEILNGAGLTRGPDGMFTGPDGRFKTELKSLDSPDWLAESEIMANNWRKAGLDVSESVISAAASVDPGVQATFPGMLTTITSHGESSLFTFTRAQIPSAQTGWRGGNRGAWANDEYDRLYLAFNRTLDPAERDAQVARMAQIFTDESPTMSLLFLTVPWAVVSALKGVTPVVPEGRIPMNVQDWELR